MVMFHSYVSLPEGNIRGKGLSPIPMRRQFEAQQLRLHQAGLDSAPLGAAEESS